MKKLAAAMLFAAATLLPQTSFCQATQEEPMNIYASKPQTLPIQVKGDWSLESPNGRLVKSGAANGPLTIELPALDDGVLSQDFMFAWQSGKRKLVAYNQKLFTEGLDAEFKLSPEKEKMLKAAGLEAGKGRKPPFKIAFIDYGEKKEAQLKFIFTAPKSFPLPLKGPWSAVSLLKAKFPGPFSLLSDKDGQVADMSGTASCLLLEDAAGAKSIILPPAIDLNDIETMLFIKSAIQEEVEKWKSSSKRRQ